MRLSNLLLSPMGASTPGLQHLVTWPRAYPALLSFFLSSFSCGNRESRGSREGEGSSMTPTKRQVCDTLSLNHARPEPMPLTRHESCVSWAPPHLRHESRCGGKRVGRGMTLCAHTPPFGVYVYVSYILRPWPV